MNQLIQKSKRSISQDRLGTNLARKSGEKDGVFSQGCTRWQCFPQYGSGGGGSPTKIHSSYITGWGVAGKALDATSLNVTRGPYQLVDTVFANPVDPSSCAMGFGGDGGVLYSLALSNASSSSGCVLNPARNTPLFEPFIDKNDHFTKTGSGQT
jgi:hypothetical protein